ncbi:MAG: hypothetical protein WB284_07930, partial [Methanoregula sp.]|uniref:hypothetical protein n=1 Tax=Methanoregula sp. TaxID=2052170 RepID=UPI003C66FF28
TILTQRTDSTLADKTSPQKQSSEETDTQDPDASHNYLTDITSENAPPFLPNAKGGNTSIPTEDSKGKNKFRNQK